MIDLYEHFDFEHFIGKHVNIIHNRHFEAAIIKVQSRKEDSLTWQELPAKKDLLLPAQHTNLSGEAEDNGLLFTKRVLICQHLQDKKASGVNIHTNFLQAMTNDIERLFSMAKQVFCPSHCSLQPRLLEVLLFLNKNWMLWNPLLVT
jgi:hypothetical protein